MMQRVQPCGECGQPVDASGLPYPNAIILCVNCEANPVMPQMLIATCCSEMTIVSIFQYRDFIENNISLMHEDCIKAGD